jgi:hypothetical protein
MTMDPDPTETTPTTEPAPAAAMVATPAAEVAPVATATAPVAGGNRVAGKTRNPWGVWGLSIITLGIYHLYWYYKVNAEVRDYDPSIEVEPGISLLAQFIPIANLVSIVKTAGRIARAESSSGASGRCSGGIGFLLIFVFGTWVVYYQGQLNQVWAQHGSPEPGTRV